MTITLNGEPITETTRLELLSGLGIADAAAQASLAQEAAGVAAAWSEGTEPGGAGTKSAKEWATSIAELVRLDPDGNAFSMGAGNDNVTGTDNTASALEASRDLMGGIGNTRYGRASGR